MSLGIVFKGPEGIVLAADSRVTLMAQVVGGAVLPSTFDNTMKLLRINGQDFVGIITYGLGAIGQSPRTAYSYVPEFEATMAKKGRMKVGEIAKEFAAFFMKQWENQKMPNPEEWAAGKNADMVFLLALLVCFSEVVGAPHPHCIHSREREPIMLSPPEQKTGVSSVSTPFHRCCSTITAKIRIDL